MVLRLLPKFPSKKRASVNRLFHLLRFQFFFVVSVAISSWPQLHSFSIGLAHAPDLLAAQKVAAYLGTVHHEYVFTVQEGLDAIPDVIYHLETYDVTTVRASTPMYLLSRKIKAMGVKMVLSGEGSDEIFGGMSPCLSDRWIRCNSTGFYQAISISTPHRTLPPFIKNV